MLTPAPHSTATERALIDLWYKYWGVPVSITGASLIVALGLSFLGILFPNTLGRFYGYVWGSFMVLVLATWTLWRLVRGRAYHRDRQFILDQNELDYDASLRLQVVLDGFNRTPVSAYSITEPMQVGNWLVFRVEHFMGGNAHATFAGSLGFNGFIVEGSIGGRFVPNLLDASTILFLQNGNQTMRAILPSPSGIRALATETLSHWFASRRSGSHVDQALWSFRIKDEVLLQPISHPVVIDRLDAACSGPPESRPTIRIAGQLIQPGVVLVSALQLEGRDAIFLPSGFFHRLGDALAPYIGPVEQPKLVGAIT